MPYTAVLGKYKRGTLMSGSGHKVTSHKQAVAIMLSEKRSRKPEYRGKRVSAMGGK
jgi:hypothetical protein